MTDVRDDSETDDATELARRYGSARGRLEVF